MGVGEKGEDESRMTSGFRSWNLRPGDWARAKGLEEISLIQLK